MDRRFSRSDAEEQTENVQEITSTHCAEKRFSRGFSRNRDQFPDTNCAKKPLVLFFLLFYCSVFLSTGIMSAPSAEGPGASGVAAGNRRLQQTQAQVDEVVDIMRVNVDKVLERDQKLTELDDRADALQAGASQFETNAAKLKRKYWWKNCKMWAILIVVLIILIVIIIIWSKS
ncbi:hypothetical protein Q7C36_020986 [Tachysurus vachellii]|uniref:V-SNARE coiled-coil homology domain-containing protein n=1 Tax=Tachysurus vachellii TaxID=175792 RepID=A0AA88J804_TACVA|nr:hypothetical protein Q7C36_020986 [Tachysurus vachellii]